MGCLVQRAGRGEVPGAPVVVLGQAWQGADVHLSSGDSQAGKVGPPHQLLNGTARLRGFSLEKVCGT